MRGDKVLSDEVKLGSCIPPGNSEGTQWGRGVGKGESEYSMFNFSLVFVLFSWSEIVAR